MAPYQGTFATIYNSVLDVLKMDAANAADLANAKKWVNLAYAEVVQQTGALQKTASANLTSGDVSYVLPSDVSWIKQLVVFYQDGQISPPLRQVSLEQMLAMRRTNQATGQQVLWPVYALAGQSQIEFWPAPGTGQSMQFWYVYLPDALVADGDQPVILEPWGSNLLTYGASVMGAKNKKDPLLPVFQADYLAEKAQFMRWLNQRQTGNGRRVAMELGGGPPQLWLARDVG